MRAVAVIEPGRIEVVDIPKPVPGPYEALVRNQAAYICNATDRKVVGGHFPGIGPDKYPLLLGHESVGVVEEAGLRVTSFKPGDRVIGGLLLAPTSSRYTSGWGADSDYVLVTDHAAMVADGVADAAHGWSDGFQVMRKVPSDIPLEAAGLLCTWREVHAAFSDFQLRPGDNILVFGAGPVGLTFCRLARLKGLGWVGVVDPLLPKRKKAQAMGADETFEPDSPALAGLVKRRGAPLDAVIDAVGSERIINAGIPFLKMAGAICVYGVVASPRITLDKENGPYNFNIFVHQWPTRTWEAAAQEPLVEWIRAGKLSHADFLTAEYPVEEAARAMQATEEPAAIKTLLRFDRGARR